MKHIKCVLFFLVVVMLLSITACNRVGDTNPESSLSTNDESYDSQWTCDALYSSDFQWKVSGLFGASENELNNFFSDTLYCNDMMLEMYATTPKSIFIRTRNELTHLIYDFASGTFTSACKDPLCNHEECIWKVPGGFFYCFNDAMYVVRSEEKTIYKSDLNGALITKVYKGKETPYDLKCIDGVLYFQECSIDPESDETVYTLYSIDNGGNAKALITIRGENNLLSYLPVGNGDILYSTTIDSNVKLYNQNDNSAIDIGTGILLCAFDSGTIYYETDDGFYASTNKNLSDSIKLPKRWADIKFICNKKVYYADVVDNVFGLFSIATDDQTPQLVHAWQKEGETCCLAGNLLFIQRSSEEKERYNCFEMIDLTTSESFSFTSKRNQAKDN